MYRIADFGIGMESVKDFTTEFSADDFNHNNIVCMAHTENNNLQRHEYTTFINDYCLSVRFYSNSWCYWIFEYSDYMHTTIVVNLLMFFGGLSNLSVGICLNLLQIWDHMFGKIPYIDTNWSLLFSSGRLVKPGSRLIEILPRRMALSGINLFFNQKLNRCEIRACWFNKTMLNDRV